MNRTDALVSRQTAHDGGFTVVEFVAASVILFIVLMGVLGAVQYAGAATRMSAMRQGAIDVATQQIEYNRNLPWADFGLVYANGNVGNPPGDVPAVQTITTTRGTYTVNTVIWWALDKSNPALPRAAYKKMRVTVSWAVPTAGSVAIETAVFGKGVTGNTGLVQVLARDVDNPGVAVPMVTAILDPITGTNMQAFAGTDGMLLWSDVPVGKATFSTDPAFNGGWLVDVSGLGSPTIIAGFQNLGFIYCQKACTATIHVHSTSVANYPGATITLVDTDRGITYTGTSDGNGNYTFPYLWKSKTGGYTVKATAGSATSAVTAFMLTASGQNLTGIDLALPDPPSITISKIVTGTVTPINGGAQWDLIVKNPSGTVIYNTADLTADSVTVPIAVAGSYSVSVSNVNGYWDNTTFKFTATAAGVNQVCKVPLSPLFRIGVRAAGVVQVGASITCTNALNAASVLSTAGVPTGIAGADGTAGFVVQSTGNYNASAKVNGLWYVGPQTAINVASPPSTPTWVEITPGILSVAVPPGSAPWQRVVAIYDSSNQLETTGLATIANPTPTFALPGGQYYVVICGTAAAVPPPATKPANSSGKYKNYTPPVVPQFSGGTVYLTNAVSP
jgi:hypothetical protein